MARLFQSKGVKTHYKPVNSLRANLVAPKDKITLEQKSGTVYHIKCKDCPAAYVGESERALKTRLALQASKLHHFPRGRTREGRQAHI